jgi:signal transduction histidine kinase
MASFPRSRREAPTIIDRQLMEYLGKDGIVCMPLRWDGDKGGACLIMGIDNSDWPYIEQRQPLLTAIAAGVGASMQRTDRLKPRIDGSTADHPIPNMARTRKIVHEISNPLSIIKNYLSVFARRTGDPSTRDELRIINEELNRVAELIKSLTAPSAPATRNLEPVDVNAVILDIVELFRDGLPPTPAIALDPDLDDSLPKIASDRNRLKQVLMNLLKNAMEAMPDGGTIQVRTRAVDRDGRPLGDSDSVRRIKISVCDDGPGVDEGIKNDLFNPHVTSKTGHDGLGLTIVHETVSHLKGSLQLESTPGLGTCFHIELPTGSNAS